MISQIRIHEQANKDRREKDTMTIYILVHTDKVTGITIQ